MGQSPEAVICLLLLCICSAAAQSRNLQQANAPALAPRAKIGTKTAPQQPTNFKLVRGAPVNTENGAFVGCFDVTKLVGIDWGSQHQPAKITQCRKVRSAAAATATVTEVTATQQGTALFIPYRCAAHMHRRTKLAESVC
jgi:hypothetical protein